MIKALRKQKKMSQMTLAKKASITQAYLSGLESGKKKNPSLRTLEGIAEALEVPVHVLLRGQP